MPRKIIDIFPPNTSGPLPALTETESPELKTRAPKKNIRKRMLAAVLLFLFLSLAAVHFFFAKAEVKIWLAAEALNISERVVIDSSQAIPDFEKKVIPGKVFQAQSEVSDEFTASGTLIKKAEGIIRLYNSFTTQSETWLPNTRFVSSEGKLFLSKDRIQIPGATINNGRISSSFVEVPVIAAEGGQEYNIGPSNFSVAAFKGTARFTSYYGQSSDPMVGGGAFPMVTQEDLQQAANALVEKAMAAAQTSLAKIIPGEFAFLGQAQEVELLATSSSAAEGDEVGKFQFELGTNSGLIAFESKHAEGLAKFLINSAIPPEKKLYEESLKLEYKAETVNLESEKMTVLLEVFARAYQDLDLNSLKRTLSGRPLSEARALLHNQQDIVRAQVKVFPFWLRGFPKQPDRITVKLSID